MFDQVLQFLDLVDDFFWGYFGVPALVILGLYFTFKSYGFQMRFLPRIVRNFMNSEKSSLDVFARRGISPLHTFFASIGGCVGIGNVVGVCTAVQIGGPGAVFWMWVAGFFGMLVKYAEIYLGLKYRVKNNNSSYDGGPMIYLQRVFSGRTIPLLISVLLCIYGVEIYMFNIITHDIITMWSLNNYFVIFSLLAFILLAGVGGLRRVGQISSVLIPVFLTIFFCVSIWIFLQNIQLIPWVLVTIFKSAFTGHAAVGGFAGASFMIALSQGVKRACYSGDLGIGYASVIHSESSETSLHKQACLGILGVFLDTFIVCTLSVLLILITGVWKESIHSGKVLSVALGQYFPYINYIWPFFIFLLGYSSIISFFAVGRKAALFLSPRYGEKFYFVYAAVAFLFFAFFVDAGHSLMVMSITGMLLLFFNVIGMFILRNEIKFDV